MSRLILLIWKYYRLKRAIVADIRTTRVVERFKSKQAERTSVFAPLVPVQAESTNLFTGDTTNLTSHLLLGWQFNHPRLKVEYNFGVQTWQTDLDWLAQFTWPEEGVDALILVNVYQTPVIELIDLVEQINKVKPLLVVKLGIYSGAEDTSTQQRFDATWQQFAQKHRQLTFARFSEAMK